MYPQNKLLIFVFIMEKNLDILKKFNILIEKLINLFIIIKKLTL